MMYNEYQRISTNWADYELIDASAGERLERWGDIILIRPDPVVIWNTPKDHHFWKDAHARYIRSNSGGGYWEKYKSVPESWGISYDLRDITLNFNLKLMGFKHTGIFPEQAVNWEYMYDKIRERHINDPARGVKILNLFAYTGAATLACAAAGARVTHVDASKGMVAWGKENAAASSLSDKPVRWLVDDCSKFIAREQRRGNKYDAVIMDPPSYGRGPGGEIWNINDHIYEMIKQCAVLLSDNPLFFIVNSYTAELSPALMGYMLDDLVGGRFDGKRICQGIGLPLNGRGLPCGATAIWQAGC